MTKFGDKTVLHVHVQVTSSFSQPLYYHENLLVQYKYSFSAVIFETFIQNGLIFSIYLLKTSIVGTNEYPQCMFWIKKKKIRFTPANHIFLL